MFLDKRSPAYLGDAAGDLFGAAVARVRAVDGLYSRASIRGAWRSRTRIARDCARNDGSGRGCTGLHGCHSSFRADR